MELIDQIKRADPMHAKFVEDAAEQLKNEEWAEFDDYIRFCRQEGRALDYLADCYHTLVKDTQTAQMYFARNRRYEHDSFDAVASSVYHNDSYMSKYMHGLAISAFLWPNHAELHRFFVRHLPTDISGHYLEIGPGHGFYFLKAAKATSYERFTGVDISRASIEMTRRVAEHFLSKEMKSFEFLEAEFLEMVPPSEKFDAIVMGEVLEHVETPERFLHKIAEMSSSTTHIYITTCVNAPAIDHIYLFRTIDEIESMIESTGLTIDNHIYVPYTGKTLEQCKKRALPVNVAYVLKRAPRA